MNKSTSVNDNGLLDPDVLSRIPNLLLQVKTVISHLINSGLHRSMYHGSSIEFSEHKQYSAGDDPKRIDWKLFGKTDKYYIKQFENEANMRAYLLIDSSASMAYKGADERGLSKLEYSRILLASLAYILINQQDHVGIVSCLEKDTHILPPGARLEHLKTIINKLERLLPVKGMVMSSSINLLAEYVQKRGVIIVASDLLEQENNVLKSLKLLKQRHQKIIIIHILHNDELTFPFTNMMEMFDMEGDTKERIAVNPGRIKNRYLKELNNYIEWWKRESAMNGFEYHLVDTSSPVHLPLIKILSYSKR